MYAVSEAYKQAIKKPIIESRLSFDILGTTYDESHILSGSFGITNQCTETSDVILGSVFMGQLTATFVGVNIPRNAWRGQEIEPFFELMTDPGDVEEEISATWERVPLGIFTVTEATHTKWGVDIKAYDNMRLLDKNFSLNQSKGYLYDFLRMAATACNIALAQSESELKALPNGLIYFSFYSENDVETWRDLVSWIAQTYGGYATITRDGKLEIRTYKTQSTDTLTPYHRHEGGAFSDYVTHYTGVSYVEIEAQYTRYIGAAVDDGARMNLGSNPFLQVRSQALTACNNILIEIAKIAYTPFKISTVCNPAYDLGDIITFTGGLAGTAATGCIMSYDFSFHDKYSMAGYGADPDKASAKSKTDKNIAGLLAESQGNTMAFYEIRNAHEYIIRPEAERKILHLKLATNFTTRVQIHININLQTEDSDEDNITTARVTYIIDGDTIETKPEETYIDGKHVMHLMYILPLQANQISYFEALLKAGGGSIEISPEGVWLYAAGLGLVGDSQWDGELYIEDTPEPLDLEADIALKTNIRDTFTIDTQVPAGANLEENPLSIRLAEITVRDNINERVMFNKSYMSEITWFQAYRDLVWANAYQDYIWGRVEEDD